MVDAVNYISVLQASQTTIHWFYTAAIISSVYYEMKIKTMETWEDDF